MTIIYECEKKGVKKEMVLIEPDPLVAKALIKTLINIGYKILQVIQ